MRQDEVVNPWAVCHAQLGKKKTKKFERCVMKIKSKHGIKENSYLDEQADYIAWLLEKHTEGATVAGEHERRRSGDRPRNLPPTGRGAWEPVKGHDAKVRGRMHRASLSGRREASRAEGGGPVMSSLTTAGAKRKARGVHRGSTTTPRERLRRRSSSTGEPERASRETLSRGEPAGTAGARVTQPTGEYAPEIDLTSPGMKTVHKRSSGGAPGKFARSKPRPSRRHLQGLRPVGDHTEYEGPSLGETSQATKEKQRKLNPRFHGPKGGTGPEVASRLFGAGTVPHARWKRGNVRGRGTPTLDTEGDFPGMHLKGHGGQHGMPDPDYSGQADPKPRPVRTGFLDKIFGKRTKRTDTSTEYEGPTLAETKDWMQKAVKRPGRCTPMPNPDCPVGSPQYNLGQRFKEAARKEEREGGTGWQGEV